MLSIKERNPNTIQNPEADTKILFNDATDGKLKTKDSAGTIEEVALVDENAPKVYVALLTQTGTDAPVATVLQNTLGGTVVWSRSAAGDYIGILLNVFTENKTGIFISPQTQYNADQYSFGARWIASDQIGVITMYVDAFADGILNNNLIKIEVYP